MISRRLRSKLTWIGTSAGFLLLAASYLTFWSELQPVRVNQTSAARAPVEVKPHPRLLFGLDDESTLQARADTTHQNIWAPIRDFATEQLGTSPPLTAPSDGDLDTYRKFGNQLIPYAFTCLVTAEVDYCQLAQTHLLTYAQWEQWGENNYRDLGHAHMLMGASLAYDWLYTRLSPDERALVRSAIADWAQKMYDASISDESVVEWRNWWRKSYMQNHHWTNNSALGIAGLALQQEDERAVDWLALATERHLRVRDILNNIGDGSWHEGISYQSYGLTLSLPFWVNARRLTQIDLLPHRYLQNYASWRLYNHLDGQSSPILALGTSAPSWGVVYSYRPQNLLRFVASEYDDSYAEWTAQQIIAGEGRDADIWGAPWYVFEFFYHSAEVPGRTPGDLPLFRLFPDIGALVWRTGWETDDLVFGFKAGPFGGQYAFNSFVQGTEPWDAPCIETGCQLNIGHDHSDDGSFFLAKSRHILAPESEGVSNDATAYHNSLLIDGQGQYRPPESNSGRIPVDFAGSNASITQVANTPAFNYVAADLTGRYKQISGINEITRHVLFVRPEYFAVVDRLDADEQHTYEWVSHFDERVSVEDGWIRGDTSGGPILGISTVSPASSQYLVGNDGEPYIRIRPEDRVDNIRFAHLLIPSDESQWPQRPTTTLLADSAKATAFRVTSHNGNYDDLLFSYVAPANVRPLPYAFDGYVAAISRGKAGRLMKIFTYGGTFLTDQAAERTLVTNLTRDDPFVACYLDRIVVVQANIRTSVTLYAPEAEQLFINGAPSPYTRSGDYIRLHASRITSSLPSGTTASLPRKSCSDVAFELYLPTIVTGQ